MNRSELIAELGASNPHLQKADVGLTVAAIFDQITAALVRGARVELRGFGVFTVKQRNVLIGHDPRTGEPVPVAKKGAPFFKLAMTCAGGSIAVGCGVAPDNT